MVKPTALFFKKQNSIISAATILGLASGLNALLGFVKGRVLTQQFGVSTDLAVFYTADRIPNFIYSIIVVGAISTVFIPVFGNILKINEKSAWRTASIVINSAFSAFILMWLVICIFSYQVMQLLSLGQFSHGDIVTGSNLIRIMLTAQMILIFSSFVTSILQSFKYFLIPALAPVIYNFGFIFGAMFLSDKYGIYGPALGVVIGSVLHLVIQIPLLRKIGFSYSVELHFRDKGVREIYAMVPARIGSVFIANALATINNSLAILISSSSVIYLRLANQLQFFPVSLFGASLASAILPTLSQESDEKSTDKFKKTFLTSFHQMTFLVMPASMGLIILRIPIVRLVYGTENFPWEATLLTAYSLAFFGISIFAQSAIYLITRAFYALKDPFTTVKISFFTLIINLMLSLFFIKVLNWGVWSVAFSFSISSLMDMGIMLYFLNKKVGGFDKHEAFAPFIKISYATLFMGLSLYIPLKLLDEFLLDTTRTINLIILTTVVGMCGGFCYFVFVKMLNIYEIEIFYKVLRRFNYRNANVTTTIGASDKSDT